MAYVVGENCIKCKYTDCVDTCPVEAFFEGPNYLVIDPDACIDCGMCEPACPADAIFKKKLFANKEDKVFIQLNKELAQHWPLISESKEPLVDADKWNGVEDKLRWLEQ